MPAPGSASCDSIDSRTFSCHITWHADRPDHLRHRRARQRGEGNCPHGKVLRGAGPPPAAGKPRPGNPLRPGPPRSPAAHQAAAARAPAPRGDTPPARSNGRRGRARGAARALRSQAVARALLRPQGPRPGRTASPSRGRAQSVRPVAVRLAGQSRLRAGARRAAPAGPYDLGAHRTWPRHRAPHPSPAHARRKPQSRAHYRRRSAPSRGGILTMPLAFSARTDRSLIRAGAHSTRYVLVQLTAPAADRHAEPRPVNLALVLDRSGSMEYERKFDLARQAVERALRTLRPIDRFSLLVYDDCIDVLTPSTPASQEAVSRALESLARVGPRGSTDLGSGWLRGWEQVAGFPGGGPIDRCLLLSDGLANRGITDRHALAEHAGELLRRGVATSTFGVGGDFDERLMHDLAHEGGGNFYFIESAQDIPRIFSSELGEALEVTVRSAALQVVLPPGADAEPLHRFRSRRVTGDNELHIELGDLVSNQELAVVVRVTFARGAEGEQATVRLAMPGDGLLDQRAAAELTWRDASHAANDTQPRDRVLDREGAKL